jgi:hypothetical protein
MLGGIGWTPPSTHVHYEQSVSEKLAKTRKILLPLYATQNFLGSSLISATLSLFIRLHAFISLLYYTIPHSSDHVWPNKTAITQLAGKGSLCPSLNILGDTCYCLWPRSQFTQQVYHIYIVANNEIGIDGREFRFDTADIGTC